MTICSYDNSGAIKFDVDVEMEQGYWNTSQSRLWTRVRDLFHNELVETYKDMRNNGLDYTTLMSYFYGQQISKIPQSYYNKDADIKYIPYADQYLGKAHGDGYEHLKRWLKNRIIFTDTLFDFESAYNNDVLTIRVNTTEPMEITVETYTPLYQHISWKNNQMDKLKVDGKNPTTFTGQVDALTDQEVLIYGGSNIKRITGISTMNPDSMLIGSATRLVELVINDCPLLTDINSSKANLSAHTYLNKVDLSGCTALGGTLRLNNSPLIQEVNVKNTAITSVQLPSSIRNLTALRLPKAITSLELNDARLLNTLELEQGHNLNNISLTNCNNLTNCINFDLTQVPTIKLDNSYDTEELYMSKTTDLSLNNMKNLKRLVYVPNSEVEEFNLSNLMSAIEYKITTFNCPNLTDFITTAQQRLSYGLESDGNIYPNQVFMASLLDLSSTQFKNIKLLCTTDLYKLMLPTTVENFYCDSAFDLDTTVVSDGSYNIVHGDLIEPYTTNYESKIQKYVKTTENVSITGTDLVSQGDYSSTYISILPNSEFTIEEVNSTNGWLSSIAYDINKNKIGYIHKATGASDLKHTATTPSNCYYVVFNSIVAKDNFKLTYLKCTPYSLIPTSANGSLIYNVWSSSGTQPSSTSPYIWDLTGLKFKDFHTYGMNNWVKYKGYKVYTGDTLKKAIGSTYHYLQNPPGLLDGSNATAISIIKFPSQYTEVKMYNNLGVSFRVMPCFDGITKVYRANIENGGTYSMTKSNTLGIAVNDKTSNLKWVRFDFGDGNLYQINIDDLPNDTLANNEVFDIENSNDFIMDFSLGLTSITMPQRTTGYSVRLQNADITPNNYNTMLYPLFIDTILPIVGKMDYSKYKGNNLSWAFAYTTDAVSRTPMDSRDMGNIKYDYNKLYNTDYVDITDVWVYKDTDCSSFSTNENITKAYIELTQDNYQSRIDEVLQWYPNCTEIHIFDNNDVTSLENFIGRGYDFKNYNNTYAGKQVKKVYFMENYFSKLESLLFAFRDTKIEEVYNIPNAVKNMNGFASYGTPLKYISNFPSALTNLQQAFINDLALVELPSIPNTVKILDQAFQGCTKFNQQLDLSNLNLNDGGIENLFNGCTSLTYTPILPSNYTGTLQGAFQNTKITTAPVLPDGVTSLENTFNGCTELTTVGNIPSSCNTFKLTFVNCSKLISVPQEGWNGNMYQTFASCTSLNQKFIINSATSLSWTFAGSGLTITPTLPSKMNGIMDRCFRYCKLTTPPITPNGVTSLSYCYENNLLTSAPNIPSSCTDISNYISGCSKITEVAIPVDVVTNYSNALSSCSEITDIDWTGKRTTDFSLTLLKCPSYTQEDLKELVNENLEDLYKDKIKINYGSKITINNTETTL